MTTAAYTDAYFRGVCIFMRFRECLRTVSEGVGFAGFVRDSVMNSWMNSVPETFPD